MERPPFVGKSRHSTPVLTAARYTHVELADQHREVEKLPPLQLGRILGRTGGSSSPKLRPNGTTDDEPTESEKPEKPREKPQKQRISSGEAGIRTLGRVTPSPVFKTGAHSTEVEEESAVVKLTSDVLPFCLPESVQKSTVSEPELARVIDAWPTLTEPIRSAILALISLAATGK